MNKKTLKIFLSSPSDVRPERIAADRVLQRIKREFYHYFELDLVMWEREPLTASSHFQENIIPPRQTDVLILILWSRIGMLLPKEKFLGPISGKAVTGTEWEFEDALLSNKTRKYPDILAYRKKTPITAVLDNVEAVEEMLRQKKLVEDFFRTWFYDKNESFSAAFHVFENTSSFEEILETHLRALLKSKIGNSIGELHAPESVPRWHLGNPFRGLLSFDIEFSSVFFGRTKAQGELKELLTKQINAGTPFVLVVGASGSGKSSLVKAGLLADLLVPGMIGRVGLTRYAILTPSSNGRNLLDKLSESILRKTALWEINKDQQELAALLKEGLDQVNLVIRHGLQLAADAAQLTNIAEARLIIIVDQLEEIFTQESITNEDAVDFINCLNLLSKSGLVWVIATMRSDFFDQLERLPELANLSANGRYLVLPMEPAEIAQSIRNPAREAGLQFEFIESIGISLDELIQQEAAKDTAILPLLSFVLDQLWQRKRSDGVLTFEAYKSLGGLSGALGSRAEEVFDTLSINEQLELPRLIRQLVAVGKEGQIASKWTSLDRFQQGSSTRKLIDAFLQPNARLLIIDANAAGSRVRVSHEALLTHWQRASDIVRTERRDIELQEQLEKASKRWEQSQDRFKTSLLIPQGQPLNEALNLLQRWNFDLQEDLRHYITESKIRIKREKNKRIFAGIGFVALVPIVCSLIWFFLVWKGVNSVEEDLKFVSIPSGCFQMGSPDDEKVSYRYEKPAHRVCLDSFEMGKFHVTREQWAKVMPHNSDPSSFKNTENLPIESISWNEAKTFYRLMNIFGKETYRFPTDAEYEYATRAGTKTARYWGDRIENACEYENISSIERRKDNQEAPVANCKDGYVTTAPVGTYKPNPFGLHDMLGNVFSYTEDCWHDSYIDAPTDGRAWINKSCDLHVLRGGGWDAPPSIVRSANRYYEANDARSNGHGFRLVRIKKIDGS